MKLFQVVDTALIQLYHVLEFPVECAAELFGFGVFVGAFKMCSQGVKVDLAEVDL